MTEIREIVRRAGACVCALLVQFASMGTAYAEESQDASYVSAAVLAGGGTTIGGPDLYGWSGGARVGYTFYLPFYVGALVLLHYGSHDPGEPDVRHHVQDAGAEAGYAIHLTPVIVRPTFRGGVGWVTTPRDRDDEFLSPHLGVGATVLFEMEALQVGVDLDTRLYTRLVDNGDNAYSNLGVAAYAVGGVRY